MSFKLRHQKGDIVFEYSFEEIRECIETKRGFGEVDLIEFIDDCNGNIIGVKGRADLGHGYGFNNGWKEFSVMVGKNFSFDHEFTFIDGPSDWSNDSVKIVLALVDDRDLSSR